MDGYAIDLINLRALKVEIDEQLDYLVEISRIISRGHVSLQAIAGAGAVENEVRLDINNKSNIFAARRAQLVNQWNSQVVFTQILADAIHVYHVRVCNYYQFIEEINIDQIEALMRECLISQATIDAPKQNYFGMRMEEHQEVISAEQWQNLDLNARATYDYVQPQQQQWAAENPVGVYVRQVEHYFEVNNNNIPPEELFFNGLLL